MRIVLLIAASALALSACSNQPTPTAEAEPSAASASIAAPAATVASSAIFTNKEGVAVSGYDVVSYFKGAPAPGAVAFTSEYQGAKFQFASAENKAEFDADLAKYLPQFGGYCAYGASQGHKAPTEPDTGQVIDGKLYFNYNQSVKARFDKDHKTYIDGANANWETIKDEPFEG